MLSSDVMSDQRCKRRLLCAAVLAASKLICKTKLTLIRDRSQVPLDNEDANEDEVEEDGEGEHDPGEDGPRVPRPRLVILLLLLHDGVLRKGGPLVGVVVVDLDHG